MLRLILASACAGFLLTGAIILPAPANAQTPRTNLGTLTCTLSQEAEKQAAPAGEERAMRCAFKPTGSGVEQTYSGTIRRVGDGQQPKGKLVMIWIVQGPAEIEMEPGLLAQTYVGSPQRSPNPAASATLVGERNKDIMLRAETNPEASEGFFVTVIELKMLSVPA